MITSYITWRLYANNHNQQYYIMSQKLEMVMTMVGIALAPSVWKTVKLIMIPWQTGLSDN